MGHVTRQAARIGQALWLLALVAAWAPGARGAEEGVHVSVITDEDDDEAILMESEWISLHLLPWRQALINRFVFTPTGNDIVEPTNAKFRMMGGGGLLMDCFWEQDWRFQELAYKSYKYQITKNGPEEAQVVFETDTVGWLGADNSGVISKLLSNMTMRRTVTLKRGQPFFRFDFEFSTNDGQAKRPSFWIHNVSYISRDVNDTMIRPTSRGLNAIGPDAADYPAWPQGENYIHDYTHGWSAHINRERREGLVYLMDYDYVDTLYNCGNTTIEWWYDSILALKGKPWRGRIYILPTIGLGHVDHANEHFVCEMLPRHEDGRVTLEYRVTASYEAAARVTFKTDVEYDLHQTPRHLELEPVVIDGLAVQPASGRAEAALACDDPLVFNVTALVELPDGTARKYEYGKYFVGNAKLKVNEAGLFGEGKPLKTFPVKIHRPDLPELPAGLAVNRKAFNAFGVFGVGSYRLGLAEAVQAIPNAKLEIGYCVGNDPAQNGLGDFPYDYERLFNQRVLLISNAQDREIRRIGASILLPWLKAGGGLVVTGGLFSFAFEFPEHEINAYYPLAPAANNVTRGPLQLQPPERKDHPIFRDLDLSQLPWLHFYHDAALKPGSPATVLMKAGDKPFIIEQRTGDQITMVVTVNPFGCEADFPGKPHVREWKEWPRLYQNIVRYAGQDLK